jgi:hypothetical protein
MPPGGRRPTSPRLRRELSRAVRQLAEHGRKAPAQLIEGELRQSFRYLKDGNPLARDSMSSARCGIKFFSEQPLQRQSGLVAIVRPPRETKRPVGLAREAVHRRLGWVRIPV